MVRLVRIDRDVAEADAVVGLWRSRDFACEVVPVEAARSHAPADGRIECAAGFLGHQQREAHCFK